MQSQTLGFRWADATQPAQPTATRAPLTSDHSAPCTRKIKIKQWDQPVAWLRNEKEIDGLLQEREQSKSEQAVLSVENVGHLCLPASFAAMTQPEKSACKGLEHLGIRADV